VYKSGPDYLIGVGKQAGADDLITATPVVEIDDDYSFPALGG
jgi:hypothetical protein